MTTNFNTVLPKDIMVFITDNLKADNDSSNKIKLNEDDFLLNDVVELL